ncbi:diaminohydroxyphosphoribosylaminopyrimidine deaminase/5-amino-6-(5-phosphoribosylamino)uracil reductase [Evansella vedderi]|uniref:Riboflavin biosynthesis protein RibD n=1 Tax=Evansella vedderi TaxID=38282 RepID=A0ABU0A4V5_9BACI|nr:bifunctional diaminohydroxyphosphoribosylaminopyrimidine deaminase/5-amino-6-(5-phosphoribosylamino)uracil reductase RibD [Evansella vedderi]MDQ0257708.1 diaminohydroxyphosphoribosylaminopyrimidine deaminase/5-amino-6-(5-phosphoribosylamino)uracil reductase [Evansella vedderi]
MDNKYMQMAIELAKTAKGQTTPNPLVGAVIVKNNQLIGFGAHLKAGEPHAERHALAMAGKKAEGATMYVTLEPCSHHGRTPPCADAVIEAGLKKVFVATTDPNPKVAGKGIEKLKMAGIEVVEGLMKAEADDLNKVFYHFIQTKKPFVTLKSATSLDGKIATSTGESQWITSEESRMDAHRLRHEHDAILVGVNTVLEDDPSLTTRIEGGGKHPIRIILDHHLKTPVDAKLLTDNIAPTWIFTTVKADKQKVGQLSSLGAKIITMEEEEISIPSVLSYLGEMEISSLLVEGGGSINDSFLRSGEFQQVVVYLAPMLIGGRDALSSFSGIGITSLQDAPKLSVENIERIGKDIKLVLSRGVN